MNEQKNPVKVAILTPYLTERLENVPDVEEQIIGFGYDPDNLSDTKKINTPNNTVLIASPDYIINMRGDIDPSKLEGANLVIAGSTEAGEDEVKSLKGSGLIVARYSIFYGGVSDYTGNSPAVTGYSLDIPKGVQFVKALLTDDATLDAIVEKDTQKIKDALTELNKKITTPILTTEYLDEVVNVAEVVNY
jgi:hypothetical protein